MPKGRPKGTFKTFDKERARERVRELVNQELDAMTIAQIKHAQGLSYLVSRDRKTGKFTKLTEEQAKIILGSEQNDETPDVIEVWEKDPNVPAFADLLNRTIDKPVEQVTLDANIKGDSELMAMLLEGRKRAGK